MSDAASAVRPKERLRQAALTQVSGLLFHRPDVTQPLIDAVPDGEWCVERGLLEFVKKYMPSEESS